MTEHHVEGPGACCVPWPPSLQRCFTDCSYYDHGQRSVWHALGFCTPDIISQLRQACGSPWQADTLPGKPLSVAPLTPTAMAAFTEWFAGCGQLRVGEYYHPTIGAHAWLSHESETMAWSYRVAYPVLRRAWETGMLAPVWFAGDVRHIPALLALRNRLLNPRLYP